MADDQAQVWLCGLLHWKAFKYTTPVGTNPKVRAEPLKFSDTLCEVIGLIIQKRTYNDLS